MLAIAWIISEDRRGVAWKQAAIGLLVTFATAVILLKVPGVTRAFAAINDAVGAVAAASRAGTSFVFGYLGGGQLPYDLKVPGADFVLALQALPIVLVMSVLTTLLFYWRILPPIVRGFAWLLERTLKVGGAVGLSTAANIFLGMVEAPLFIRPYLASLTRSELFIVMTGGMAGIAGTVLVLYATLLGPVIPDAAGAFGHRLGRRRAGRDPRQPDHGAGAERQAHRRQGARGGAGRLEHDGRDRQGHRRRPRAPAQYLRHADRSGRAGASRQCDHRPAARRSRGAPITLAAPARLRDGAGLLADRHSLGPGGDRRRPDGDEDRSSTSSSPMWSSSKLPADALEPRSRLIMLYAMCGFANFASLGIMIAGLATMAPERRDDVVSLGIKSIVSGTLATCLMGAIVGVLTVGDLCEALEFVSAAGTRRRPHGSRPA